MSQMTTIDKIAAGEYLLKKTSDFLSCKTRMVFEFSCIYNKIVAKETFQDNRQQNICDLLMFQMFQHSLRVLQVK